MMRYISLVLLIFLLGGFVYSQEGWTASTSTTKQTILPPEVTSSGIIPSSVRNDGVSPVWIYAKVKSTTATTSVKADFTNVNGEVYNVPLQIELWPLEYSLKIEGIPSTVSEGTYQIPLTVENAVGKVTVYLELEVYSDVPSSQAYAFIWVPISFDDSKWPSDEEFKKQAEIRAMYFVDISPLRDCPYRVRNFYVPIDYVKNQCPYLSKIDHSTFFTGDAVDPMFKEAAECIAGEGKYGKTYLSSYAHAGGAGIGLGYEFGISANPLRTALGASMRGYPIVYSALAEALEAPAFFVPAHELGHVYLLCDEYKYSYWSGQNKAQTCPNPWPSQCPQTEAICTGNEITKSGTNIYSGPFLQGNTCEWSQKYSIMGLSFERCGFDAGGFTEIKKKLTCS